MDIYKILNISPVRTEPDVWVSRLVIFECLTPEPKVIRDIHLTRGLNIVWAEETEDDIPSADITGHSAGKTTFCRFFRYVLGEKTYGTRVNMELIQNALPNGYVAAEIIVKKKKWSVLRPIGKGRNSYVKVDSSVEELLPDRSHPAYQDTYVQDIGLEKLFDGFETGGIVRTGETIQWQHLLAWCTRDQESRFQNIHDWRSSRSESDTPPFRFPKAGPLFLMRVALGLFLPDELKGEEDLARLNQEQENTEKDLERLKREPQFRINHYDTELRKLLRILSNEPEIETLPFSSGNLLPDLDRLTTRATAKAESEIVEVEQDRMVIQENIDIYGAKIRQLEDQARILDGLLNRGEAVVQELKPVITKRQEQNARFAKYSEIECQLGGILYRDCQHVQKRHNVLEIKEHQDVKAMKQAEAEQAVESQRFEDQKQHIAKEIENLARERQALQKKRDALMAGIGEKREYLRDLKNAYDGLKTWISKRDQPGGFGEIDECREKLETTTTLVKDLEQQLTKLLTKHNENRDLLASIFSGAVRAVLSSGTYDGRVGLNNRELTFSITHGSAMSGEAVETLSVLLTDIASLIYTTVSANAHLPGFLLHDSPREADLGNRIYRNLIRLVASLQEHFGESDNCPFQYILTTTTAPPRELQNDRYVKLKLNAAEPSGLLLRRNIGAALDRDGGPDLFSAKRGNP